MDLALPRQRLPRDSANLAASSAAPATMSEAAQFEALLAQTLVPDSAVIKAVRARSLSAPPAPAALPICFGSAPTVRAPTREHSPAAAAACRRCLQAEDNLKAVIKDPQSVEALLTQLTQSTNPGVRTVAAVQLRKSINQHWKTLDPEARKTIKGVLLERVRDEPENIVRKNIASVVSAVAKKALPKEGWAELLGFLQQCTQSESADHREVGLMVFERLADMAGDHFKPWLENLQQIFTGALQDPELRVRIAGLRAACQLVQWISEEKEVLSFRTLIPPMVAVVGQCLETGDEQNACAAYGVFFELVASPVPVLTPHLPDLVSFSLQVAATASLQPGTREAAIELVTSVAESKSKIFKSKGMAPAVVACIFGMMSEPEEKEDDPTDEEERNSPNSIALVALDTMACRLPSKIMFEPIMTTAAQLSNSPDPFARRAALMAVGVAAEGCADSVRDQLTELVAFVAHAASDAHPKVRDAACFAIREFSEFLQPDICQHHATLLPAVFKCLDDAGNDEVKEKAGYALESFAENLEKHILPYLAPLMSKLIELLMTGSRKVQETAVAAISSTAAAVIMAASAGDVEQEVFHPYIDQILPVLKQIMTAETEDVFQLRARATECAGILTQCYDGDQAAALLADMMPFVYAGLKLDSSELREFSYGFFANAAEVLQGGFEPYLPATMEAVYLSMMSNDIMWDGEDDEEEIEGGTNIGGGIDLGSDDSDEEGLGAGMKAFSVRTAMLDEKASACQCIGNLAEHVGVCYGPYIEQSLQLLYDLADYFHEDVRGAVRGSMGPLVLAASRIYGEPQPDGSLHPQLLHVLAKTWEVFLDSLEEEPDRIVVARSCAGIANMLGWGGRQLLQPETELTPRLCERLIILLQKKALCQEADSEEEEEDDEYEDDDDHDENLIDCVTECATNVAKCYGPEFGEYLPMFLEAFTAYCRETRPALDRSMGIGAVAELVQTAGEGTRAMPGVMAQLETLTGAALSCLSVDAKHEGVRRNGAYAIGVLCRYTAEELDGAGVMPSVLTALHPLTVRDQGVHDATVDNAMGAIARILVSRLGPEAEGKTFSTLPLAEIIPAYMAAVPIREDFAENIMVTESLILMLNNPCVSHQTHLRLCVCPGVLNLTVRMLCLTG